MAPIGFNRLRNKSLQNLYNNTNRFDKIDRMLEQDITKIYENKGSKY